MKAANLTITLALAACALAACSEGGVAPVSAPPSLIARVDTVSLVSADSGRIVAFVLPANGAVSDAYREPSIIYFGSRTLLWQRTSWYLRATSASQLHVGDSLTVWAGAQLRSAPPQYVADQIVIE
jgi:hypothetical protein